MKNFSAHAWQANLPLYERILTMPFNAELAAGTLREDRFRHYIIQDAHYLEGFARALALASAKADNADQIVQFAEVGKNIHARAAKPNPYQAWIDTYAGDEFENAVRAVIATTDDVAARASDDTLAAMHNAFTRATQLEWMFWDSAYRLAAWPI